jgi:hypothetical protein
LPILTGAAFYRLFSFKLEDEKPENLCFRLTRLLKRKSYNSDKIKAGNALHYYPRKFAKIGLMILKDLNRKCHFYKIVKIYVYA